MVTEENARVSNLEKGDKESKNRCQQEDFEVKDRCLFVCLMMVCQSRPEINLQEAIGTYEFP